MQNCSLNLLTKWMDDTYNSEKWFVYPKHYVPKCEDAISVGMMTHFGYYFSTIALGSLAIYHSINRDEKCPGIADRIFVYDPIADENGNIISNIVIDNLLPTFERHIPLKELDLVCISLTDSDAVTTTLHLLELGGIPIRRRDRVGKNYPMIIAGGPGCINPEAFADFFDFISLGDGCLLIPSITMAIYNISKNKKDITAIDVYQSIENRTGLYVPELYDFKFFGEKIKSIDSPDFVTRVKPAIDPTIEWTQVSILSSYDTAVIVPTRGCKNRCGYCQLGLQEYRETDISSLMEYVDIYLKNGIKTIIVNSASVTQHHQISILLEELADRIEKANSPIQVYIGSMCFNEITVEILNKLNRVHAFSHTYVLYTGGKPEKYMALAPEHGSSDLLRCLGRTLHPWEILDVIEEAIKIEVHNFNLYFMVGFPSETTEDREQTAALVSAIADKIFPYSGKIIVKINPLIPGPGTACQRMRMISFEKYSQYMTEIKNGIIQRIGKSRYETQINMIPLPEERLLVESIIDRADRRIGAFIEELYSFRAKGKKIDKELLNKWLVRIGLSWNLLSGSRLPSDILPWDNVDFGTNRQEKILFNSITNRMKDTSQ